MEIDECVDCPKGSMSAGGNSRYCYCPENHSRVVDSGEVDGYACYACDSGKFRAAGDIVPTFSDVAPTECFTAVDHEENWGQIAKFTSADPGILRYDQYFGKSVAVHGNHLVVAASSDATEGYGYERFSWYRRDPPPSDDNAFVERFSLLTGDAASARDSSVAVTSKSSTEAWIVIGSPRTNEAYVYACMNSICYQGKTILSSGSSMNGLHSPTEASQEAGYFGQSVAIDGQTIVVGASGMYWAENNPSDDNTKSGSAYVFTPETKGEYDKWVLRATLRADDSAGGDRFGRSVSISGDTIVVGAPGKSTDGAAYVFAREKAGSPSSNWTLTAKLRLSFANTEGFGRSVSVDGGLVAVGAPLQEKVAVFVRDDPGNFSSAWSLEATVGSDDEENHGYFGSSVVVKNNALTVAAPGDPTHGSKQKGAVLVFSRDSATNTWKQVKELVSPDTSQGDRDAFGRSLAFDGNTLVAGAYHEDNDIKGAAYVFSVDTTSATSQRPPPPPLSLDDLADAYGTKKGVAKASRDGILAKITDVNTKRKVKLLADAAIAGGEVTKISMGLAASSEDAACALAFEKMGLDPNLGACDVAATLGRRRLTQTTTYDVTVFVSALTVDSTTLIAAIATLEAEGIVVTKTEADPVAELRATPGLDGALLDAFEADAREAVDASTALQSAEVIVAANPPPPSPPPSPPSPPPPSPPPNRLVADDYDSAATRFIGFAVPTRAAFFAVTSLLLL
jgi:hypothetical protein